MNTGYWKPHLNCFGDHDRDEWYGYIYECSECGKRMIGRSNYCPNCGLKMEEEDEGSC